MKNKKIKSSLFGSLAVSFIIVILAASSANAKSNDNKELSSNNTDSIRQYVNNTYDDYNATMTMSDYLLDGERPVTKEDLFKYLVDNPNAIDELKDSNNNDYESDSSKNSGSEQAEDKTCEKIINDKSSDNEKGILNSDIPKASISDWNLILVNKQNYVPDNYELQLVNINGNMQVDKRVARPLAQMISDASVDGVNLLICSAYRSYDRQTTLFNNKIQKLMNSGMSYYEAYKIGSYSVTVPGTSEHQLGLALDIVTPSYTGLDSGFADTEAGKWLKDNAPNYGFVLRYPEGKDHITGITFEPWHFRYVGVDNAIFMTDNKITLEEYLDILKKD